MVQMTMRRCLVGETKRGRSNEWDVRAVYVHSGAEANLAECALIRATFGLWIEGSGTHVAGSHCKVRNNTRCGVLAAAGACVELQHCMAVGCKEFHGVEVRSSSALSTSLLFRLSLQPFSRILIAFALPLVAWHCGQTASP